MHACHSSHKVLARPMYARNVGRRNWRRGPKLSRMPDWHSCAGCLGSLPVSLARGWEAGRMRTFMRRSIPWTRERSKYFHSIVGDFGTWFFRNAINHGPFRTLDRWQRVLLLSETQRPRYFCDEYCSIGPVKTATIVWSWSVWSK